ncbi:hypothetical protein L2E82_29274 [Cichorium intybus]|uniref:Uncharacterized protein n=1 Tax=Cichorium intybus TaxID=13427 RepID=A0ACB9CXL5_CICIN|nr:hypothetical protein L2E82_29274 [Cichorium intybus]
MSFIGLDDGGYGLTETIRLAMACSWKRELNWLLELVIVALLLELDGFTPPPPRFLRQLTPASCKYFDHNLHCLLARLLLEGGLSAVMELIHGAVRVYLPVIRYENTLSINHGYFMKFLDYI